MAHNNKAKALMFVAAIAAYYSFYKAPRNKEAAELIQHAQLKFDSEQYAVALDGDTINPNHGFLDIIDNYSGTDAANLAQYYAGICYLQLGNYDVAVEYLNDFSDKARVLGSHKYAAIAHAHSELGNMDKALSNYRKAATTNPNEFSTPLHLMKLGLFLENQGKADEAKTTYSKITKTYRTSAQAVDAEKYLARIGG